MKDTDCKDYVRFKKADPNDTGKKCSSCVFGQKNLSECTLVDGNWTDDYGEKGGRK